MKFLIDLALWILCLGLVIGIWGLIANSITSRKRYHLIDSCILSGNYSLAVAEYNLVTFNEHHWRVFTFRKSRCLYGPLLQGIWNHSSSNNINTYDEYWWRCYNEIYLKLTIYEITLSKTREFMSRGNSLPSALTLVGIDLDERLLGEDQVAPPPKFAMTDGAEEYDQVIIAQQLMGEL